MNNFGVLTLILWITIIKFEDVHSIPVPDGAHHHGHHADPYKSHFEVHHSHHEVPISNHIPDSTYSDHHHADLTHSNHHHGDVSFSNHHHTPNPGHIGGLTFQNYGLNNGPTGHSSGFSGSTSFQGFSSQLPRARVPITNLGPAPLHLKYGPRGIAKDGPFYVPTYELIAPPPRDESEEVKTSYITEELTPVSVRVPEQKGYQPQQDEVDKPVFLVPDENLPLEVSGQSQDEIPPLKLFEQSQGEILPLELSGQSQGEILPLELSAPSQDESTDENDIALLEIISEGSLRTRT